MNHFHPNGTIQIPKRDERKAMVYNVCSKDHRRELDYRNRSRNRPAGFYDSSKQQQSQQFGLTTYARVRQAHGKAKSLISSNMTIPRIG